jgi:hypothetical protein
VKSTKTLPNSYVHYRDLRPGDYRKGNLLAFIIALPFSLGIYSFYNRLAFFLRADYLQSPTWNPKFDLSILIGLLLVTIAVIAAHESIHGLLLWRFTSERPSIGIQFPGVGVEAPDWYIPRNDLIVIGLAPFIILTTIGMVLLFIVSPQLIRTVVIGLTINIAGSYMDIAVVMYAYLLPKSSLINPAHGYAAIFVKEREGSPDQATNWRSRLRNVIEEEILPRLV